MRLRSEGVPRGGSVGYRAQGHHRTAARRGRPRTGRTHGPARRPGRRRRGQPSGPAARRRGGIGCPRVRRALLLRGAGGADVSEPPVVLLRLSHNSERTGSARTADRSGGRGLAGGCPWVMPRARDAARAGRCGPAPPVGGGHTDGPSALVASMAAGTDPVGEVPEVSAGDHVRSGRGSRSIPPIWWPTWNGVAGWGAVRGNVRPCCGAHRLPAVTQPPAGGFDWSDRSAGGDDTGPRAQRHLRTALCRVNPAGPDPLLLDEKADMLHSTPTGSFGPSGSPSTSRRSFASATS